MKNKKYDFQDGYNSFKSDNVTKNEELLKFIDNFIETAGKENAFAQFLIGIKYYRGIGEDINYQKAFDWFQKGADQGDKYAQLYFGIMYNDVNGVTDQDFEKAEFWYKKATAQDLDIATYRLGHLFREKALMEGFTKDSHKYELEALKWYNKAAEQGNAEAQYELGHLYDIGDFGFILEPDYKNAFHYYEMAAHQGHVEAQYNLGVLYYTGLGVESDLHKAKLWIEKAALQEHNAAQFCIGYLYEKGYGVKRNYHTAKTWYLKSSKNNYYTANFRLGLLYFKGLGVEKNISIAKSWWEKQSNIECTYCLSCMYKYGIGIPKDLEKSTQLFDEISGYIYDEDIIYINKKTIAEIDDMFSKVL